MLRLDGVEAGEEVSSTASRGFLARRCKICNGLHNLTMNSKASLVREISCCRRWECRCALRAALRRRREDFGALPTLAQLVSLPHDDGTDCDGLVRLRLCGGRFSSTRTWLLRRVGAGKLSGFPGQASGAAAAVRACPDEPVEGVRV